VPTSRSGEDTSADRDRKSRTPMESPDWLLNPTELESPITEFAVLLVGRDGLTNHPIGSGVFIAAGLVMTAKHVINEFWQRMGPGTPFAGRDEKTANFGILVVQYPGETAIPSLWSVSTVFGASFTDIAFLSVSPVNELAEAYLFDKLPMLSVLPPLIGERVRGFGYPASEVLTGDEVQVKLALHPITTSGIVTAVYPEYRDRGMLTFPCFEIRTYFIGGMSGGPLYNEAGQLCGLICASREGEAIAYAATLWAAMGTTITNQGPGMVCKGSYPVFEMAGVGLLHLTGWNDIAPRIQIEQDPFGNELLRLKH
jgi:hypothetical protein